MRKVAEQFAKQGEDSGHPKDEWLAVVAHQLQGSTAKLKAFVKPLQDGLGFVLT